MLITKIKWFILDYFNISSNNLKFRLQHINSKSLTRYPHYSFKKEQEYFIKKIDELSRGNS